MAKRERDGWRVTADKVREFRVESHDAALACFARDGDVVMRCMPSMAVIPPLRAIQFAAKVQEIAARAANKEAKRC